jgi:hypothetical protein
MEKADALYYLKLMKDNGSFFQPEIREALSFAIEKINSRKK